MIYPKDEFLFVNANHKICRTLTFCIGISIFSNITLANEAQIINVHLCCHDQNCKIDVTVSHEDTGWQHYANQWRVLTDKGKELGTRVLAHPHVNEQPFTRSLYNVEIPNGTEHLIIEVQDFVHGTSKNTFKLIL